MKLDIKNIIALMTLATFLGGFYYTTQLRLENLEKKVSYLSKNIKNKKNSRANRGGKK